MKKIVILTKIIACSLFFIAFVTSSLGQKQEWTKKANVAQYKGANWKNQVKRVSNISLKEAFEIAEKDTSITYFFYMKSSMFLEGKSGPKGYTQKGRFRRKDAVFFSGKPWFGSSRMADSYVKVIPKIAPKKENKDVEEEKEKNAILLKFDNINFETGTANIVNDSINVIDKIVKYLLKNPAIQIQITGHTDSRGSEKLNRELSQKRADKVKRLLQQKEISANQITTIGYGSNYPIADNNTKEGRAKNRRIEFRVPNNLIINGGFEFPQLKNASWQSVKSVKGWGEKRNQPLEIQNNVVGKAIEGNQLMELDAQKSTSIFQKIPTNKKQVYILSFCFSARPNTSKEENLLEIFWDGKKIDVLQKKGEKKCNWSTYQYEVIGTNKNTTLEFRDVGISNSVGSYLDNVTLYPKILNE